MVMPFKNRVYKDLVSVSATFSAKEEQRNE